MHVTNNPWYSSTTNGGVAHIITNRNRSKIYGNKIYLKNGQSFEIELFNPTKSKLLAKIKINGEYISDSGIVLKPGERVYLERFIDSNNKLVFETYSVEDSNEVKKAIEENGKVEIEFYPENVSSGNNITWTTNYPGYYNINETGGSYYRGSDITFTSDSSIGNTAYFSQSLSSNAVNANLKSIETDRVEKGNESNQNLEYVNGDFSWFTKNTVSYQILPESSKPIESNEIRSYCTSCGTRKKKASWKFCPSCGEKL